MQWTCEQAMRARLCAGSPFSPFSRRTLRYYVLSALDFGEFKRFDGSIYQNLRNCPCLLTRLGFGMITVGTATFWLHLLITFRNNTTFFKTCFNRIFCHFQFKSQSTKWNIKCGVDKTGSNRIGPDRTGPDHGSDHGSDQGKKIKIQNSRFKIQNFAEH